MNVSSTKYITMQQFQTRPPEVFSHQIVLHQPTYIVYECTAVLLEAGRVADEAVASHLGGYLHIARLGVLKIVPV